MFQALKHYGFQCMSAMWYPMDQKQVPFRHFYVRSPNSNNKIPSGISELPAQQRNEENARKDVHSRGTSAPYWSSATFRKPLLQDTGHMMIYFEHPDALFMRRLHDEVSQRQMAKKQTQPLVIWPLSRPPSMKQRLLSYGRLGPRATPARNE